MGDTVGISPLAAARNSSVILLTALVKGVGLAFLRLMPPLWDTQVAGCDPLVDGSCCNSPEGGIPFLTEWF
jgi:hypothetical protein